MDERLAELLTYVVEDVIEHGEPVGSQSLVESHHMRVSSATIRNWFVTLEELGYVMQPHTSGGRIPTEKGYQYYVMSLMHRRSLGRRERADLERIASLTSNIEQKSKALAKCVAEGVGTATVLGLNQADTFYTGLTQLFAQPEFNEAEQLRGLGAILDQLDEVLARIRTKRFVTPTILVGSHCPFGPMCGSVLLTVENGGLIGIFGPMRMNYRNAIAYVEAYKELIDPHVRVHTN